MYNELNWLERVTVHSEVVGLIPAKNQQNREVKSTWIWAHTLHSEATFTLGVGVVGITKVTEWAYLTSLSEGEDKVWASGPHSKEGVGLRPTAQKTVK